MATGKQRCLSKQTPKILFYCVSLQSIEQNLQIFAKTDVQESALRLYSHQLVILQVKLAREVVLPIIANK